MLNNNNQVDIFSYIEVSKKKDEDEKIDYIQQNQKILNRYKMHCRNKGLTEQSIKAIIENDLRLFLEFIDNRTLVSITHEDIQDFLLHCQEDRKNSDQALARKFTSLNIFFRTLIMQETLDMKNPLDKMEKPKVRKRMRGHLTMDEYHRMLKYCDEKNDLRGAALISLFFSSGCRLTEIWQQDRDSLDYQNRRFKVLGKGQKERICVFSEDSKERILRYLKSRTDELEPLFVSREKQRWSKKSIQDYIKKLAKRAGIKKNTFPHLMRHTRAFSLLKSDVPLEVIQRLLGHESIATTQVYARMDMDTVQSKIDQVDLAG